MFGSIGFPEILLILVLALLIFGPKRLPEVGRTIGKGLAEFRRASSDLKRTVNAELALDENELARTTRRPDVPKALGGAAAPAAAPATASAPEGETAEAPDAAVTPTPAEGTTPRGMIAPEHPDVPDETFDPSAEPPAPTAAATEDAAPEASTGASASEASPSADTEDEAAATTH